MTQDSDHIHIIDSFWFTQMGIPNTIGIVVIKDDITSEIKAYIGTGDGYSQKYDEEKIAGKGAKVYSEVLERILKRIGVTSD